jgi:hypothetical protein
VEAGEAAGCLVEVFIRTYLCKLNVEERGWAVGDGLNEEMWSLYSRLGNRSPASLNLSSSTLISRLPKSISWGWQGDRVSSTTGTLRTKRFSSKAMRKPQKGRLIVRQWEESDHVCY